MHPHRAVAMTLLMTVACSSSEQAPPEPATYTYRFEEDGPLDQRLPSGVELVVGDAVIPYAYGATAAVPRELLLSSAGQKFALRTNTSCGPSPSPVGCDFDLTGERMHRERASRDRGAAIVCKLRVAPRDAAASSRLIVDNAGNAVAVTVTVGRWQREVAANAVGDLAVALGACDGARAVSLDGNALGDLEPSKTHVVDATRTHCYRVHTDTYTPAGAGAPSAPADIRIDGKTQRLTVIPYAIWNVFTDNERAVTSRGAQTDARTSLQRVDCASR